jgi:predicted ATPase
MEMACQRARDLSQQLGETAALSRALGGLAIFNYVRARHQRAHSLASEALALAEEAGDLLLTLVGHWRVGFVTFGQGDYVHAQEHMAAAIDLYEPARQHQALIAIHGVDAGASAMAYNACCLGCLGHLDSALAEREKALSLACELDHAFTLADVLCYACCTLSLLLGDGEALISDAQAFVDLAKNKGLAGWMKMAQCFLGEGLVLAGDVTAGITQIRESLAVKIAADERVNLPGKLGSLAQAYLQLGVLPEAELALAEGFRQLERSGERMWESDLHRLQGELCWARGDIDAATQAFDRALVAARRQRARSWELRAATGLARMRRAQGDIEGARELLVPLMDWFGECTYAPILARAKALLAELPYN